MIAPPIAVMTASWIDLTNVSTKTLSVKSRETLSSVGRPSAVVNAPIATISVGRIRNTPT